MDFKRKLVTSGDGENLLAPYGMSGLLYQAKPARSVYNSPLIKANRAPLWKSPPPFTNLLDSPSLSSNTPEKTIASKISLFESPPSVEPLKTKSIIKNLCNSPSLPLYKHRLYPSIPQSDPNEASKSPLEEKELKEYSNRSTASAMKKGAHDHLTQCDQSNCKSFEFSMKAKSAVTKSIPSLDVNSENDIEVCSSCCMCVHSFLESIFLNCSFFRTLMIWISFWRRP